MTKAVYNTTEYPIVVDEAGHSIGGFDRGDADPEYKGTQKALKAGRLIDLEEQPADGDGESSGEDAEQPAGPAAGASEPAGGDSSAQSAPESEEA